MTELVIYPKMELLFRKLYIIYWRERGEIHEVQLFSELMTLLIWDFRDVGEAKVHEDMLQEMRICNFSNVLYQEEDKRLLFETHLAIVQVEGVGASQGPAPIYIS